MLWSLLIALVSWLVMLFVSTNFLGLILRGLLKERVITDEMKSDGVVPFPNSCVSPARNVASIFIGFLLGAAYFGVLYKYLGGLWATVAGVPPILARIPDLLIEIRTGRRITKETMSRKPLDYVLVLAMWASLPLLWFAIWRSR